MLFMANDFCAQTANIWQILGYVVNVIKIVIPLVLIILGMLDLGKAVVANDDKAISKSVSTLVKRFIAAVVMFFIPTIISAIFNVLNVGNLTSPDAQICVQCVTNVNGKWDQKNEAGKIIKQDAQCKDFAENVSAAI